MRGAERRAANSRWVRYWSLHGKLAAGLVFIGWTLIASADGSVAATPTSDPLEVVKLLIGGALLLFGFQAGFTSWIINPAVDRKLAAHRLEAAGVAHNVYVSHEEWERKHRELADKVDSQTGKILDAITALDARRGRGHE